MARRSASSFLCGSRLGVIEITDQSFPIDGSEHFDFEELRRGHAISRSE
jgi:hypothetical protein